MTEEFFTPAGDALIAERQLRQQAEISLEACLTELRRFRRYVETTSQGVWEVDQHRRTVFVNEPMAAMLGYSVEEMAGRSVVEFLHPQELVRAAEHWELRTKGLAEVGKWQLRHRDGHYLWTQASATPIHDSNGDFSGSFALFTDISDQVRAEQAWRESETRVRQILHNVSALVYVKDRRGRYLLVNPAFEETFHLKSADVIGRTDHDLFGAEAAALYARHDDEVMSSGMPSRFEEFTELPEGRRTYISLKSPLRNSDGEVYAMCGVSTDITEPKRIETELKASRAQLLLAMDAGRMASWTWDFATNALTWSKNHYSLFGYERDDFPPRLEHWRDRVHPDDLPRIVNAWHIAQQNRSHFEEQHRIVWPNGSIRWVQVRGETLFEGGEPVAMTGVVLDIGGLKQVESDLRASELRHREQAQLLDLAHDAIIVLDFEGRISFWNRGAESTYGWRAAEAAGQVSHSLLRTMFPQPLADIYNQVRTKDSWRGELTHFRRDGSTVIVDSLWALQRDASGEPVGIMEINRDITERRQAERALAQSEELAKRQFAELNALYSTAPVGLAFVDSRLRFLRVNEQLADMNGLPVEEHLGRTVRDVIPVLADFVEPHYQRVLSEGVPIHHLEVSGATGRNLTEQRHWLLHLHPVKSGSAVLGVSVVVQDITERKNASQKIEALELRQRAMIDHLPIGIWFLDSSGAVVFGNKAGQEIWRGARYVPLEQIHEYKAWWHESGQPLDPSDWGGPAALRNRKPVLNQLLDIQCFDGTRKTILNSAVPMETESGSLMGVVVFNLDVTEQAQTQAELKRSHEELERRVAERTARLEDTVRDMEAFSYSLSHDMRAPLRAMYGFSKALRDDYSSRLDAAGLDFLHRIERGAKRLDGLIRDVLSYSRVAKEPIQCTTVDLDQFVKDLIEQYPAFEPANADVTIDAPLGKAVAHEAFLSQVLSNLLVNATKFIAPGVRPAIRIQSAIVGNMRKVSVTDNGIGIAPRHRDRIFTMFGRVHSDQSYEGTGIGLAIARKAIERLGGEIGFESVVDQGTTFWFTLPLPE